MIVDIVLIVSFLAFLGYGLQKGIYRIISRILSVIVSIIAARILSIFVVPVVAKMYPPELLVEKFKLTIDPTLTHLIYPVIIFFILLIMCRIVLAVAFNALGIVFELPLLKQANKLVGAAVSLVLYFGIAFTVLALLYVFQPEVLAGSQLAPILLNHTPGLSSLLK
ncbi:MAG: CvpA family protein [Lactobacillales bacterium]|jgi:hypothetical protein|nr:CvpA family protein [Lactobacillales bacterium]